MISMVSRFMTPGMRGDVDPDELAEVVEIAQRELDDHVELAGDVVAGAHAGHRLDALLELPDGTLAVLAQTGDDERAHGDAQYGGVDDGAIAADGAAALEAPDAAEHGRRRQIERAREREIGHASVGL